MPRRVKKSDYFHLQRSKKEGDIKIDSKTKSYKESAGIKISHNTKYSSGLEMIILDKINLKIIEELLNNPDIKSSDISQKLKVPLSTVQRRRGNLEKTSVLKKSYEVDLKRFGLRIAEISLHIEDGETQTVVNELKTQIENKILRTSLRIGNPVINASVMIIFQSSEQLFNLLEKIKKNPYVSSVEWSEYLAEDRNNQSITSFLSEINRED